MMTICDPAPHTQLELRETCARARWGLAEILAREDRVRSTRGRWYNLGVMQLDLIRHGDAAPQKGKGIDYPLSATGVRQAELLAKRLAAAPPNRIYASPILRAKQTAEAVSRQTGLEIVWDERFREIESGNLRELTREQREQRYPRLYKDGSLMVPGPAVTLDFSDVGGEGPEAFSTRISSALQEVILDHHSDTDERIALIAHGGVINAALTFFLRVPFTGLMRFRIRNTSISSIRIVDGLPLIVCVNDHAHLA